jgi:hypothetical protein
MAEVRVAGCSYREMFGCRPLTVVHRVRRLEGQVQP